MMHGSRSCPILSVMRKMWGSYAVSAGSLPILLCLFWQRLAISAASGLHLSLPLIWVLYLVNTPAAISSTVPESPKQETAICADCSLNRHTVTAGGLWVKNPKHRKNGKPVIPRK